MSAATAHRVRLFLDANILVSAAWKEDSKVARLWQIPGAVLLTSNLVVEESERNLPLTDQRKRLTTLLNSVHVLILQGIPLVEKMPPLPEKDKHVFAAAVLTRAQYLVTGDFKHFGAWFGKTILGIRIEPPASILRILHLS